MRKTLVLLAALLSAAAAPAAAQFETGGVRPYVNLSGPRVGLTAVTGSAVDRLRDEVDVGPVFTQFGWQWERAFAFPDAGLTAVTEWVLLAGGLEQGVLLPSLTWLVGLRGGRGTELGVGPNLSAVGVGLAIAGGATARFGELNVPVNLALVPGSGGVRFSVLTGFNSQALR